MALQLPVPEVSYSEINITLSGVNYYFIFRFNTRFKKYENDSGTWVFDIYNNNKVPIIKGIAVVGQGLLLSPLNLDEFAHGDIFVFRANNTELAPTRSNVGIDKDYQLIYLTNEELADAVS